MANTLMPCKLETMIYAIGDGTYSVFTLNPALQKQLDTLATQHPEVCCRKEKGRSQRHDVSGQKCGGAD